MVVIIQSTAAIVQIPGATSDKPQVQAGGATPLSVPFNLFGDLSFSDNIFLISVQTNSSPALLFSTAGTSDTTLISGSSPAEISFAVDFVLFPPSFERATTLFGVLGTSGTAERFFDRGSTFFTPSELDSNRLRDISEAQQFLLFSSAEIISHDILRRVPTIESIATSNPKSTTSFAHIDKFNPSVVASGNINVLDQTPPLFIEMEPEPNSSFNPKDTDVELHVFDSISAVSQGTIDIFIDGTKVVNAGTVVTGTLWPVIEKTILSSREIEFIFRRGSDFTQGSIVVVSGTAKDVANNTFVGSYSFQIEGIGNLPASISGSLDVSPPVINPLVPISGSVNVSPDTAIRWSVFDLAQGVDTNTVKLIINGASVVDGDTNVSDGVLSIDGNQDVGFFYTYEPDEPFAIASTVNVSLSAKDLVGNSSGLDYSFQVFPIDSLQITNFFLAEDQSVLLTSGTNIAVDVIDTEFGVNTSGTFFFLNGQIPSGLNIIPITSGIRFSLPAQPLVDFREDLNILVIGQNNFPGNYPVIRQKRFRLLEGYDVFWANREIDLPEEVFEYFTDVPVIMRAANFALNDNIGGEFYRFKIETQASSDLPALIESNVKIDNLSGLLISNNPFFEFGKTILLEVEVADLEGNKLEFSHTFKIQGGI